MPGTGAAPFVEARDFLLRHREDYDVAYRDFRWPQLDRFNWALDYFDVMARGNDRPALVIVSRDPSHDTPKSTRAAVARWGLGSAAPWHWLLGSRDQLAPVLRSYRVDDSVAGANATAPVYLIDREGFQRAGLLYPFPPGWPAGDLRILAGV